MQSFGQTRRHLIKVGNPSQEPQLIEAEFNCYTLTHKYVPPYSLPPCGLAIKINERENFYRRAFDCCCCSCCLLPNFLIKREMNKGSEHNENVDASRPDIWPRPPNEVIYELWSNIVPSSTSSASSSSHLRRCHPNFVSRRIVRHVTHSDIPSTAWHAGWAVSVCLHWNLWPQLRFSGHSKATLPISFSFSR